MFYRPYGNSTTGTVKEITFTEVTVQGGGILQNIHYFVFLYSINILYCLHILNILFKLLNGKGNKSDLSEYA
jgi:hypothetical protein